MPKKDSKRESPRKSTKTCTVAEEILSQGEGSLSMMQSPYNDAFIQQKLRKMSKAQNLGANLSQKETTEIRDLFNLFDIDGNGSINKKEFRIVMNSLGYNITDEMACEMMNQFDDNDDDGIDIQEFVKMMDSFNHVLKDNPVIELRNALRCLDKRKTGHISAADIRQSLSLEGQSSEPVDDDEINEFLKALAIDGGTSPATLTHDDFISFIMSSKTSIN